MLTEDRVTTAYDAHYDAVRYITTRQFRVPDDDADQLIHDVYVAFIRHHATIANDEAWLVHAARNACRNYWRDLKRTEDLPTELIAPSPDIDGKLDLLRMLRGLSARCREILIRYAQGFSAEHIAQHCAGSQSKKYGRNMISACVNAARAALGASKGKR
jgi:DNA-directed RNA polymerase specialized sigma24 family protein